MIEKITMYRCTDGTLFDCERDAESYDELMVSCRKIEDTLVSVEQPLKITEYIQQDTAVLRTAFSEFLDLVETVFPVGYVYVDSYGRRTLSTTALYYLDHKVKYPCLGRLYARFTRIDFLSGKEYAQHDFVSDSRIATICVNSK